ncbi:MHC class II transactivator isoform A [Alligator mississippiensis]|uniref:MHC class II transactivator isoform A n=1 Tax=Alligator mississippiensis TaxID=8496 RepID=A0A151N177_ALLMI|nr:MHC class II transactivator isoform A [Alligator mississippiensis]
MNLFKEILPRVRKILSSATLSDAHALLSLMLKEDVISKEYYQTLLHEKDREDLARKISLTFVEKWDLCLNTLVPLCYLKLCNNKHQSTTDGDSSLNRVLAGNKRQTMDSSILTENSFLDLLHSDIDPVHLYTLLDAKSIENAESEVLTDPETDTINHDQFNNLDIFYTMENSESGEELYICSNTREAYARIAGLAEYVLKDPQERQMEDTFAGNLIFDEMATESTEGFTDVKMQKCHKRTFLGTAENHSDTSEPKCRKTVDSPAVSTVNSSFLSVTLSGSPVNSSSFSLLHIPFSVTTISPTGRSFIAPGSIPNCLPVSAKGIQVIPGFPALPQQIISLPVRNGASDIIVCPGSSFPTETSQLASPILPVNLSGVEISKGSQIPFVPSKQTQKRPKPVEAFCMSLKDYFCDVCKFMPMEREVTLDQLYIEGALLQGQHETKGGKNIIKGIEKEPVIYDLEEKEKTALERNQIFQVPGGKELETKIIVLLGKAGMGKSILVQKICQDWSNGKFSQFEFVFLYECRRLSLPEKRYSLKDLLLEVFVRPQEGKEEVFKYILQNPSKVLLIFDGFEELQDHDGFTHFPDCQSYKELYSMRELFAGLFQKKILSGCTLLLTARPKDKLNQYLSKVDKIIEMVGFSPQQNIALRLERELSFLGTPLTPPDVYVLRSILKRSKKEFALDLRNSAIDLQGMKDLVGLKNVTSFRASLTDTIRLWESLEQTQEYELLKISIQKFAIDPFKAKTMRDISDLSGFVHMQEKMIHCMQETSGCQIHEIPAIKNLKKLEFALGPACGPRGFLRLVEILVSLPSLQQLDLDALSENGIGDEGVKSLSQVFSQLTSLEVLNLSQNKITDLGAENLATALPSLSSLKTLSLYNNSICDAGAENIAKVLPAMASLRVLDVQAWRCGILLFPMEFLSTCSNWILELFCRFSRSCEGDIKKKGKEISLTFLIMFAAL